MRGTSISRWVTFGSRKNCGRLQDSWRALRLVSSICNLLTVMWPLGHFCKDHGTEPNEGVETQLILGVECIPVPSTYVEDTLCTPVSKGRSSIVVLCVLPSSIVSDSKMYFGGISGTWGHPATPFSVCWTRSRTLSQGLLARLRIVPISGDFSRSVDARRPQLLWGIIYPLMQGRGETKPSPLVFQCFAFLQH